MCNFYENVKNRAYYKSIENPYSNSFDNWLEAELDEKIEQKIIEEAYLKFLSHKGDDLGNYFAARNDIEERLRILAYYIHERNYNEKPRDAWIDAEKLYVDNF